MMIMLSRSNRNRLLEIPEILAMVAVTIAGLLDMTQPAERILVAILLAVFALILFAPIFWSGHGIRVHAGLAILSALVAVLLTLRPGWNFYPILFFLMAPTAMIHLSPRAGFTWIGLFTLITGVIFVMAEGFLGLAILLPFAAGYIFFGVFGWMTVEADRNRARSEQLLTELQTAHRQLQENAIRAEELAIVQERNRIARDVHDSLGHRLTVAAVQLEGAQRLVHANPERAEKIIATVRDQIREGLADLRRTVAILRATVDEDLPITEALARLARQFEEATGLAIHLALDDCPERLPLAYRQAIYRAVQEGLTNIQRHARASEAWIQISQRDGPITLLIGDNGAGMPAATGQDAEGHFGLVGMKEKAALLGGEFFIDPRPGGGTQLTFRLPAPAEEAHG